ncbi:MAG: hypothetical protein AAGD25_32640 [Cyanobacteria bacterium P01_F01_bin.150]
MINSPTLNRTASFAQKMPSRLFYSLNSMQNWIKGEILYPVQQKVQQEYDSLFGLRDLNQHTVLERINGVTYYLWQNTRLDVNQPTYVVTHGWCSGGARDGDFQGLLASIKNYIPNANIIFVDWTAYSNHINYAFVRKNTLKVGDLIGHFLIRLGINASMTTLIGHSMGAHALGNTGAYYTEKTGNLINTIIALEPAGPLFKNVSKYQRLNNGDAEHVIALHSTTIFGYGDMIGDVDIYLNDWSNNKQPGSNGITNLKSSHTYPIFVLSDLLDGKTFKQGDYSLFAINSLYTWPGSYYFTTQ